VAEAHRAQAAEVAGLPFHTSGRVTELAPPQWVRPDELQRASVHTLVAGQPALAAAGPTPVPGNGRPLPSTDWCDVKLGVAILTMGTRPEELKRLLASVKA
jgi:hypothetical protein